MPQTPARMNWFRDARIGLFCHLGLYSLLGRGEWVMNRECIAPEVYEKLADQFTIPKWSADAYTRLAQDLGAQYLIFTTKHHEGFCLFDSKLTDYTSVQRGPKRDLVAEVVTSARRRGLKIALYFSLNDWHSNPSGLEAYEDYRRNGSRGTKYRAFIAYVHGQVRELMTNYGKIDVMWYDGWWPFDAKGWQAEKLNAMVRELQPHILFNNRNCLAGDFATPEQHALPTPDRMNEACFTLNDHWGYCFNDDAWKSPRQVIDLLLTMAKVSGNLAINVGPAPDGSIPAESVRILREVGRWVKRNEESLRPAMTTPNFDWNSSAGGAFTARQGVLYMHCTTWLGPRMVLNGVRGKVTRARFVATGRPIRFKQVRDRLELIGMPEKTPDSPATVIALEHRGSLTSYQTGGMRIPRVPHCQYDPVVSNLAAAPK